METHLLILIFFSPSTHISILHVYWFLRYFPPYTPSLLQLCTSFFQKIIYSNILVYQFRICCTHSTFIPASLAIREMRVYIVGHQWPLGKYILYTFKSTFYSTKNYPRCHSLTVHTVYLHEEMSRKLKAQWMIIRYWSWSVLISFKISLSYEK